MTIPSLIIGIIFLVLGIYGLIGSNIICRFSSNSCKIVKFNDIHKKFERDISLESFINRYSIISSFMLIYIGALLLLNIFFTVTGRIMFTNSN